MAAFSPPRTGGGMLGGRARVGPRVSTIRALVADHDAPGHIAMARVDAPVPGPHEAVIDVKATSLNRGEVRNLQSAAPGWRPGWDVAGVVTTSAADHSGPPAGTRVVGLAATGGWAERVAVSTELLAQLPDRVSFGAAATLPVAGLTALRAVDMADRVDGRSVLVTGASGGVGRFAVQIAAQLGADVTAVVSSDERGRPLLELGAASYVVGVPSDRRFDLVIDGVGGETLAAALACIARNGLIVSYGNSSGATTTFDVTEFYRQAGARLYGFQLMHEVARHASGSRDLGRLVEMVADGHLDLGMTREGSWTDAGSILTAFWERAIPGKAVLYIE